MVAQYDPRLKGIGTNSSAWSQGDGIIMASRKIQGIFIKGNLAYPKYLHIHLGSDNY